MVMICGTVYEISICGIGGAIKLNMLQTYDCVGIPQWLVYRPLKYVIGCGFAHRLGHTKDYVETGITASLFGHRY